MNKYQVMPQVVVYRDMFEKEELVRFYELMDKYETDTSSYTVVHEEDSTRGDNHGTPPPEQDDDSPINSWVPWHTFGKKTFYNWKQKPKNLVDEDLIFLYDFREKLLTVFKSVFKDYIDEWSQSGYWPDYITSWELNRPHISRFSSSIIEVLKHDLHPEKQLAITFHTDAHKHRVGQPRGQQIITITIYVNDDYEGGEVQFLNEIDEDAKVITYKPKYGDVTAFPSGIPYWHSAAAVTEGNKKLFVRMFAIWDYEGSKEWFEGIEKHGEKEWNKLVDADVQLKVDTGIYDREVNIEGKETAKINPAIKVYVKKENDIYIDGRTL
jgi:hypothetical protein